jgi:hypothetical protein
MQVGELTLGTKFGSLVQRRGRVGLVMREARANPGPLLGEFERLVPKDYGVGLTGPSIH